MASMSDTATLSDEQKQYLEGFLSGIVAKRGGAAPATPSGEAAAPTDIHRAAQDRFLAAGKKLVAEEEAKRKGHPLDMWDELVANADAARFPKGTDIFRHKFFGLFYVAPTQDSFMCRLRIPNGMLNAHQFAGIADIAQDFADGNVDITTRANLQLRTIKPGDTIAVLTAIQDLGLTSRGAGADNIRNVTGSPLAGIDPQELIDTAPLARALHFTILNHRELYGLPRKFNIAFDGGGQIGVLEDTNDIGFAAVKVPAGAAVPAGVYFRMQLGGITGHGDFARDTGILLKPEECVAAAVAVVRVFIAHGDRTDRKKARLKYLLDSWGFDKFIAEFEKELPFKPLRLPLDVGLPRGPVAKHGHIGGHPQKPKGLNYLGVAVPVGRLSVAQIRGLAAIARDYGGDSIRLTVWQNLILAGIPNAKLDQAKAAVAALGLDWRANAIRGALVACTGNTGCKFSATDTKGQAIALAEHLESRVALDQPINIHLTGCPHSCAQHYVGDIGLLGVKIAQGDDMVEGYSVVIGGGAGAERALGRELWRDVPMAELPEKLERMLKAYLAQREGDESFHAFTGRRAIDVLRQIFA
jgi:ferredoxin-nitrite reductase